MDRMPSRPRHPGDIWSICVATCTPVRVRKRMKPATIHPGILRGIACEEGPSIQRGNRTGHSRRAWTSAARSIPIASLATYLPHGTTAWSSRSRTDLPGRLRSSWDAFGALAAPLEGGACRTTVDERHVAVSAATWPLQILGQPESASRTPRAASEACQVHRPPLAAGAAVLPQRGTPAGSTWTDNITTATNRYNLLPSATVRQTMSASANPPGMRQATYARCRDCDHYNDLLRPDRAATMRQQAA